MGEQVACFLGHRTIGETEQLRTRLYDIIEELIVCRGVDTFLFGSKSRFNDLCHEIVTKKKEKYPHIKRVYVRAEYPYISDDYKAHLLQDYEDTYYPEIIMGAGRAVYIRRNEEMINNSRFCVFYYDEKNAPTNRKSGTEIALNYALKKSRCVMVLPKGKQEQQWYSVQSTE